MKEKKCLNGKNNPNWKGDNVGYSGLHAWVTSHKGIAKNLVCSINDNICNGRSEWSNISGKYLRKLSDWRILCATHHRYLDGNIDKLLKAGYKTRFQKEQIPWNKGRSIQTNNALEEWRKNGGTPWNKNKTGLQVAWNKGKKHTEESKKKMSESTKRYWANKLENNL